MFMFISDHKIIDIDKHSSMIFILF